MKLDTINWLILEQLQRNSRMPLTEIAKKIGTSSPTVSERIQKMEDAGVIKGYETKLNLEKIGYPMSVFISAKIRFGMLEKFNTVVKQSIEITECHSITGNDCLLLRANVKDTNHLEILNTTLSQYGELTTSLILSSVIENRVYKKI